MTFVPLRNSIVFAFFVVYAEAPEQSSIDQRDSEKKIALKVPIRYN